MSFSVKNGKAAGIILFIAASQFILSVTVAEDLYPGYSVENNYISDLGVGTTAHLFNVSIIVLGLLMITSAVLIRRLSLPFIVTLILSGIGSVGVGVFPETTGIYHTISALLAFLFASVAPYFIIGKVRNAISALWGIMGTLGIVSLILFDIGMDFGIGRGGMERMILYADIIWALSFSGWLFANGSNSN
ncbi:MAG: DUF998 domain-containing protein [Thermoplasmataceae archaeon]